MLYQNNCLVGAAVANQSGAMEEDTISKKWQSSKCLMSRGNMMQRTFLIVAVFCVSMASSFAQDTIMLKNGTDIQAMVQDIGIDVVRYKRFDNANGPTYSLEKSEIVMIQYANGSRDVFMDYIVPQKMVIKKEIPLKALSREGRRARQNLHDFESRLNNSGFTRRIVSYDFLTRQQLNRQATETSILFNLVGIWINDQEQLIALRLDSKNWNEIVIPFDKVRGAEIFEIDKYTKSSGYVGILGGVNVTSTEFSGGLQVRIVADDISRGTQDYILKIYDSIISLDTSHPNYITMMECAQAIKDEINNIILRARLHR